jgi:bifunctional UDP-N-acetylglucosamine pyrophosphorylase/glucosamine-1-phosphate N-acetyltransferase
VGIVEHHDCSEAQLGIREVNPSYYCFDGRYLFDALHKISPDNRKGEYYITDAIGVLRSQGLGAGAIPAVPPEDAMGINSRMDLAVVGGVMQRRIQQAWMKRGVTLMDPSSTWINAGADIGEDTVILPFSFVDGGTRIGAGCQIGPFGCVMRGDQVAAGKSIGPCDLAGRVQP